MLPGLRAAVDDAQVKARSTRERKRAEAAPAETDPVARVLVDLPLAHLDRPFDYLVPATMDQAARPGSRVKVRFAGQDVDGFVLDRGAASDHPGRLQPLRRVVSDEPVLTPEVAALAGAVAERYAGTRSDVLRLAVPPRHATTERQPTPDPAPGPPYDAAAAEQAWNEHVPAAAFLRHLADGGSPRAVWGAAPGSDWPLMLAHAAAATTASGRGVVLCVPDHRDVARVQAACEAVLGEGRSVALTADLGPAKRYAAFLALNRGAVRVVVGTRAAAWAPVREVGLLAIWDDGDDLHEEPRAPYPHTREVLRLRADLSGAGLLVGGVARTVEADELLAEGAHEIAAPRAVLRDRVTVSIAHDEHHARLPREAHRAIKGALERGPVLVQTPRAGYAARLACETCRAAARCRACTGPLRITDPAKPPSCDWCGRVEDSWTCPTCGGRGLRAPVLGDTRTAEELGRTFAPTRVLTSSADHVVAAVPDRPAIVVATPGAEPVAEHSYAAVVLMDTWIPLARADLRSGDEALRRWLNAAALARPGASVVAVGDPAEPALQALVRWDPAGFARRQASERAAARLPPGARIATVTGAAGELDDALTLLDAPPGLEVLGPVPVGEDQERAVLRVPVGHGEALGHALAEVQRLRSARKLDAVRIQLDPVSV